jgi:hypothetical protein
MSPFQPTSNNSDEYGESIEIVHYHGNRDITDDIDDIVDEIAEHNALYENEENALQQGEYCIGAAMHFPHENEIVVSTTVSSQTLMAFDIEDIQFYLSEYSCISHRDNILPEVHIMKVHIKPDGLYSTILKTFWIKWIQRAWKTQFAKRCKILRLRSSLHAQRYFEMHGQYPHVLKNIPTIHGILAPIPIIE